MTDERGALAPSVDWPEIDAAGEAIWNRARQDGEPAWLDLDDVSRATFRLHALAAAYGRSRPPPTPAPAVADVIANELRKHLGESVAHVLAAGIASRIAAALDRKPTPAPAEREWLAQLFEGYAATMRRNRIPDGAADYEMAAQFLRAPASVPEGRLAVATNALRVAQHHLQAEGALDRRMLCDLINEAAAALATAPSPPGEPT